MYSDLAKQLLELPNNASGHTIQSAFNESYRLITMRLALVDTQAEQDYLQQLLHDLNDARDLMMAMSDSNVVEVDPPARESGGRQIDLILSAL